MKCPVCKTADLLMTERRSIEIDYCPVCRGVWLDRGELDKLIAQDAGSDGAPMSAAARPSRNDQADRDRAHHGDHAHNNDRAHNSDHAYDRNRAYDNNRSHDSHRTDYRGHKKKRSLFDMFDFD
ncbi:zf-TFIIB domain-containing protein [Paraburkholderia fungorum]|uniref:TFIIB-type zinc ribbon-containing protein n=1 Tax=Paraburkholderia fungorum TaxID=134537 RepID=UPI0038B751F6